MVGGAGGVLAGGFVARKPKGCCRASVRRDWDRLRACQCHYPLAIASRLNNSFVSGSRLDSCGLNGSRSPTRVSVPDLGRNYSGPFLTMCLVA